MDHTQDLSQININQNINPLFNQYQSMYNPNFFQMNQNNNFINQNQNNMNNINYMNQMINNINCMNQMMNMMLNMNQMISFQNQSQIYYEDIYPYIKEDKLQIILITSNNNKKYIKIPSSLRKNELYIIAQNYKIEQYSDIKLFHKNKLIENDDSPIEFILNNDSIKIIEELDVDLSYYNKLLLNFTNQKMKSVVLETGEGKKISRPFPIEATIQQILKSFLSIMKIPFKNYKNFYFLYNGKKLDIRDNILFFNGSYGDSPIIYFREIEKRICPGKLLIVTIENEEGILTKEFLAGTLQQIKNFYEELIIKLNSNHYKLLENPVIYPGNIELKKDDERTFSKIGIRSNFICKVKTQ